MIFRANLPTEMASQYTVHTSTLFDPKGKEWLNELSITIEPATGSILRMFKRNGPLQSVPDGDVDLRGEFVLPGFVDAHAHIFLHSYA